MNARDRKVAVMTSRMVLLPSIVTALALVTGCNGADVAEGSDGPDTRDDAVGPGAGGGANAGFREKDTRAIVERPVEGDPSAKIRLVRKANGRREPHYVAPGVDVLLAYAPHGTRWVVSGAARFLPTQSTTVVCLTTTDTLSVATGPSSIQSVCALIDRGARAAHDPIRVGSWIRGISADGRISFTRDADPFRPVRHDDLGRGCDAMAIANRKFVFLGASFCSATSTPGAVCEDPCFNTRGKVNAEGFCDLGPNPTPYCPAGKICTGDPDPAKRCR